MNSQDELTCEFCKKQFSVKNSLNIHKKTAKYCLILQGKNANKEFICEFCDKSFTLKQSYQEHLLICKTKNTIELNKKYQDYEIYIKKIELEMKKQDEYIKKNNCLILEMKEREIQLKVELKQKDEYIFKLEESLEKANKTIADIAIQPKTTNNNNNNNDNYIHNETYITNNFDINDISKIANVLENHLTTDVLRRGQEGVADMLKTYLLQTDKGEPVYECTDVARQKFEFRNVDGNIETDPNATKLIRNLGRSGMWVKAHSTGKKIWEKEDGTVNYEAQEVFLPNVMEVLEIDKDSKKLRRRLASITARQKQNTKKL